MWHTRCSSRGVAALRALGLLVALVAVVGGAGCGANTPEDSDDSAAAIVGGVETLDTPAVGYLAHGFQVQGKWIVVLPFCTGTLVAPDVVLTAAHCLEEAKSAGYALHFGTGLPRNPRVLVPVKEAVANPDYAHGDTHDYYADVAYLVLEKPILGVPVAHPKTTIPEGGCDYDAIGYGNKNPNHAFGTPSADSDLGIRKKLSMCADDGYNANAPSSVTRLTVGAHSDAGSPCEGDSGGPLLRRGSLEFVGVLSNGGPLDSNPTCTRGAMNYYAPFVFNIPFVQEALAKSQATTP